ncbi:MAG: condensation domain-containing protein, partial [Bacteroidota bacterium]
IKVIQLEPEHHFLLWSCHHILLDGWSSALILKDVFSFYKQAQHPEREVKLPSIPTYRHYQHWQQKQELQAAKLFWKEQLADFSQPSLLGRNLVLEPGKSAHFRQNSFSIDPHETATLEKQARQKKITLNTFIQGAWALILSKLLHQSDLLFGISVSGRSSSMPQIEHLCGMLMNVLPLRVKLEDQQTGQDCLGRLQQNQARMLEYDFIGQDQIQSWIDWPEHQALFDSLFVFENFPSAGLEGGDLKLEQLESDITSTYPLTCVVKPGTSLEIILKLDTRFFNAEVSEWLLKSFSQVLKNMAEGGDSWADWGQGIETPERDFFPASEYMIESDKTRAYQAPRNEWELKLTRIWENLFDRRPISVHDNFFEIGGRSLLAVRMFAQIKSQLDRNLPPTILLENPTIAQLATKIEENQEE